MNQTVLNQLAEKKWDIVVIYVPGMQPIQLQKNEPLTVNLEEGFISLGDQIEENENGKYIHQSNIKISSIATIDFITKSTIITPAKGKLAKL